jgi:molecular chaperone GrpE
MTQHHRTRAEERIDALDVSPAKLLADLEVLRAEVETLRAESEALRARADEHLAGRQRALADYQNLSRQKEIELTDARARAADRLILKVVDLVDDFDRALEHIPDDSAASPWVEGIAAIDRKLRTVLDSEGVAPIEALGRPFDPSLHEAAASIPGTGRPDGEIVAEMRRGYMAGDRVLRPSMVGVSDGTGSARTS